MTENKLKFTKKELNHIKEINESFKSLGENHYGYISKPNNRYIMTYNCNFKDGEISLYENKKMIIWALECKYLTAREEQIKAKVKFNQLLNKKFSFKQDYTINNISKEDGELLLKWFSNLSTEKQLEILSKTEGGTWIKKNI